MRLSISGLSAQDAVPEEQPLYASQENKRVDDWSRDGRLVAFSVPRQGLWILDARTMDRSLVRRTTGSDNGMQAEFSPDAKFIAYAADDSGRPEVYVEPVPATGARGLTSPPVRTSGGVPGRCA